MKLRNLFLFCLMTLLLPLRLDAEVVRVPDTLMDAYYEFLDIVVEFEKVSTKIQSPEDLVKATNKSEIDIQQRLFDDFCSSNTKALKIKEFKSLHERFQAAQNNIDKNIAAYQQKLKEDQRYKLLDSIDGVLRNWVPQFEALLQSGTLLSEQKKGDTVQCIKRQAEKYWTEDIAPLYSYNRSLCESDSDIKDCYEKISALHTQIQNLSEEKEVKEKTKIGDYLFKIILVLGVATMAIGIIASQHRSSKLRKQAEKGTSIDL